MRKNCLVLALLLSVAIGAVIGSRDGMTMDMNMNVEGEESSEGPNATTTLIPVPHRMSGHHGVPILQTHLEPEERLFWEAYNTTTFLTDDYSNKFNLYLHIATILLTTMIVYPLSMVAKNVLMALFYIPLFLTHCVLMAVSLISLSIYGTTAPADLYPGNAYSKMSWILAFTTGAHIISAAIYFGTGKNSSSSQQEQYHKVYSSDEESAPISGVSSNHSSGDWEHSDRMEINRLMNEKISTFKNFSLFGKIAQNPIWQKIISILQIAANYIGLSNTIVFNILHWGQFFFFLVYIPTGVATVFLLGKGNTVFNILAHFIKGGVFFSLGLLSLARYCGAFKGKGWAWNAVYSMRSGNLVRIISMEMVESGLILFYGCTNIFMEHLANPGGEWSAKDLQHASIAFIYIGAGLCGVITELKLALWRMEQGVQKLIQAQKESNTSDIDVSTVTNASPGYSPNPFPIFTIFWTGILMSKHAQASALSTEIHSQWGNLLVYGTVFRFITYLMMMFLPASIQNLTKPTKPITELITSFALLCGGLVFMESTDPVVLALEYRGFTAMFTLNLSLGFIALLMAWEMTLFAFKDWLQERRDKLSN